MARITVIAGLIAETLRQFLPLKQFEQSATQAQLLPKSREDFVKSQNPRLSHGTDLDLDLLRADLLKMINVLRAKKTQIDDAIVALERVRDRRTGRSTRTIILTPAQKG